MKAKGRGELVEDPQDSDCSPTYSVQILTWGSGHSLGRNSP